MPTLKVISGPAAGESLGIEREVVIGREGADLTITDPQISRRHTALRPVENGVEVEDLGSLNGTFVNGERLTAPMTLRTSGKIQVGDSEIEIDLGADGATQIAPAAAVAEARGSVRRVEEPAAAAAAAVPAAQAGAAPSVAPPPRRPTPPPLAEGPPAGRPAFLRWLPLLLLVLAGGVAAALYFALRDDDAAVTAYPLVASIRTADITQGKTVITFAGTVNQTPGGLGAVVGRITLASDITAAKTVGKAVKLTGGSMVFRFDDGRYDATLTGTATRRPDKTTDLVLTGKIIRGTREFEGAKGSFKLKSRQEVATVPTVGIGSFEGTIRY